MEEEVVVCLAARECVAKGSVTEVDVETAWQVQYLLMFQILADPRRCLGDEKRKLEHILVH